MGVKRFQGFPDKGIGKLVEWVHDDDHADGGYFKVSTMAKQDKTKVSVPKELINWLRDQLVDQGNLSASKAAALPNNKVVLYYLFDAITNQGWGDILKKTFDSQRDEPFHAIMRHQAKQKEQDEFYGHSDRELLTTILKQTYQNKKVMEQSNARRSYEYRKEVQMLYGLLRSSAWIISERTGDPQFNAPFVSKIHSNFPDGFKINLNVDRLSEMSTIMQQFGRLDYNKSQQQLRDK